MVSILAKRFRRKAKKGGKPSEKVFIGSGDVVLVAFRSFENKCDIIYKYEKNEISRLMNMSELPQNFSTGNDSDEKTNKYDGFELDAGEAEEEIPIVSQPIRKFEISDSDSDGSLDIDNI